MASRRMKQLGYGAGYAAFWILIIVGIYFTISKPAPSCFDHIQNEGETGVDCGGPCAAVCLPSTLKTITVLQNAQTFSPESGHYALLGQIGNANADFASPNFSYTFNLYDASDTLLQSVPGSSFIYAGEVKYLLVPNLSVSGTVDHATLTIGTINWTSATSTSPGAAPDWNNGNEPSVTGYNFSPDTVTVNGSLTDSDITSFNNVLIVAVFVGNGNNPIGASQTELNSIAPNQTETFSIVYPIVPGIDPALTQFYAYALRP